MTGLVFDIQRYAIHDGPGIRTAVFFKGCPLRCPWCHNPESQEAEPELSLFPSRCVRCGACVESCAEHGATMAAENARPDAAICARCGACVTACAAGGRVMIGRPMSVAEVLAEVERDRVFYEQSGGGVTFTGGEPLMQAEFLLACLAACRQRGMHTAVDTCGYAPSDVVTHVAGLTDLFLYDLKLMDDARHERLTGVSNAPILANLRALVERRARVWLRVPVIPDVNDDEANLTALPAFVQSLHAEIPVHLLPYHRLGGDKYARLGRADPLPGATTPTPERMAEIAARLRAGGVAVKIGG